MCQIWIDELYFHGLNSIELHAVCLVTRMTRQLTVPKCDGPILVPPDVSSCCAGTLSPKTPRSAGDAASWARLLCRRSIDLPAVSKSPIAAIVGLSSTCSVTCSGVFAWGHGSLLSHGCSIDNFVRPDYLRPPSHAAIRLGVVNVHTAMFNQDYQSISTLTVWPGPCVVTMLIKTAHMLHFYLCGLSSTSVFHMLLGPNWWKLTIFCL